MQILPKQWRFLRGDIYLADLGTPIGSQQGGKRPVIIVQNDVANRFSPTVTVVPLTSKINKKTQQPTHCLLEKGNGLCCASMVLAEQTDTVDKQQIIRYLGRASNLQMQAIDRALDVHLGHADTKCYEGKN